MVPTIPFVLLPITFESYTSHSRYECVSTLVWLHLSRGLEGHAREDVGEGSTVSAHRSPAERCEMAKASPPPPRGSGRRRPRVASGPASLSCSPCTAHAGGPPQPTHQIQCRGNVSGILWKLPPPSRFRVFSIVIISTISYLLYHLKF